MGICGMRYDMVEGEHAQLEKGVVAACRHVGQRQACEQLRHGLTMRAIVHHLCATWKISN